MEVDFLWCKNIIKVFIIEIKVFRGYVKVLKNICFKEKISQFVIQSAEYRFGLPKLELVLQEF